MLGCQFLEIKRFIKRNKYQQQNVNIVYGHTKN